MKTINKDKTLPRKKIAIIGLVVILIALGGAVAYAKIYTPNDTKEATDGGTPTSQTNLEPASDEQKQAGDDKKQSTADSTVDTGTTPETLTVTITAFNQNGTQVQIRTLINEVSNAGSCTLTLENSDGTKITKSSDIQAQPSSSSCKGFDLTTDELTPGVWKATVNVSIGTLAGSSTKTLTIQ